MGKEIFIPKLGQTMEEATLVRWLVPDGALVEEGQAVLEVETDKAVFGVEAPVRGTVHQGPFPPGMVVPVLTVVATVGAPDEAFVAGAPAAAAQDALPVEHDRGPVASQPLTEPPTALQAPEHLKASPRARKLAAAKGVELAQVQPTGYGGLRVAERDVIAFLKERPRVTPVAQNVAAQAGLDLSGMRGTGLGGTITRQDVERSRESAQPSGAATAPVFAGAPAEDVLARVPLKGVRAIIAERMAASVHTSARVTLFMEADATELVTMRARLKSRVESRWGFVPGYNDLIARAVILALREFPYMNARLTGDAIEHLTHIHLGMAVDTERGLLVPVIREADKKSLREFGVEFREKVARAQKGQARPDDLGGGTFTITNLGMYDVLAFTPVINLPEAAILGVGTIGPEPKVREGQIVIRQMTMLSLVFDHRLVDGAPAARFLQHLKDLVEEPYLWIAQ